ncbi:MAG: UDP-N-acetylglucosamine 2-epimerase (hydrolyzing) [Clostridia bacterium]|nr:UDP-N-acetylglucosamine 2-epimerase (hydrolyzing) [Clostridia bacterium]
MNSKICVVTATRAEYGLLSGLIKKIHQDQDCELQLIVTGTHLDPKYGNTFLEIVEDGIPIQARIPIIMGTDEKSILATMANAIMYVGECIFEVHPDIVVVLGDRYEIHAIASACVSLGIPLAHISGGEISEGAYDEFFRHSITKMAYLHFTSTEENRQRVIQMGEHPQRVFNVGDLGVENIITVPKYSKQELEAELGIGLSENLFQVTFHPTTLENSSVSQFVELLDAISERSQYQYVFSRPNADTDSDKLNLLLDEFVKEHSAFVSVFPSLGYRRFLSLLGNCKAIIGNSSSGIVEAPSLRIGTIDIGARQQGRDCANTVIHCLPKKDDILAAIDRAVSPEYRKLLKNIKNPYQSCNTSGKILEIIKKELKVGSLGKKTFYRLEI